MYGPSQEFETEQEDYLGEVIAGATGELEGESHLTEVQEAALAHELLEVQSEEELEQFLGNLLSGAAKAVGGFIKSPVGQALGGALKNVAKSALPAVGGALGSFVAPGIGTAIGSQLGSMASNLFEYEEELASIPVHEQELEVARRIVRLGVGAGRSAARSPRGASPRQVVNRAMRTSAARNAPGLLKSSRGAQRPGRPYGGWAAPAGAWYGDDEGDSDDDDPSTGGYGGEPAYSYGERPRTGRWVRRGRRYILLGT
ncbi:MAG: hypothetical protein JO372_09410 [Solirubrobacterales bacterium]|nr:hypothetical protein [Solirubrobacterales bacterium]